MDLPLPNVESPELAPFWASTRQHKLSVQECDECGYLRWPPTPGCPECLSFQSHWANIRPEGTLYSYATYHRAMDPRFADQVPYSVAYVELLDGPRMIGTLLGDADSHRVGAPLTAVFDDVSDTVTLVRWQQSEP